MNSALPNWVQYLQAFATPAIAFLAFVVGFAQWRISKRKIVLDLFDKRLVASERIRVAVAQLCVFGAKDLERINAFESATYDARFLFGQDVNAYLKNLRTTIWSLHEFDTLQQPERGDGSRYLRDREQLQKFYDVFPGLLADYMRMDHKLSWLD